MKRKHITVVAAIIKDNGKYLATQRNYGEFKDGWEFPGGKIEPNETPEEAVKRELEEEAGIQVLSAFPYEHFQFEYPTKIIEFYFFLVEEWIGEPFGREGQEGFWIAQSELDEGQFPPANEKLIGKLKAERGL